MPSSEAYRQGGPLSEGPLSDEYLETPDDPRVSEYRDVPEPQLLHARGLFVAEGRLVVQRLIEQGRL